MRVIHFVQGLFAKADANSDGKLSFDEYYQLINVSLMVSEEALRESFKKVDLNGSGNLDMIEACLMIIQTCPPTESDDDFDVLGRRNNHNV